MKPKVISITFEVDAQSHKDGQFTVPKEICDLLAIGNGSNVIVEINDKKIPTELKSGTEIYGSDFNTLVKAGEKIKVTLMCA